MRRRIPKLILPHQVVDVRHAAGEALERAFERSDIDATEDWLLRCHFDLAQLWRCGEFWAVTQVVSGKCGLILHIVAAAGEYDAALLEAMETWGRGVGCVRVVFTGRVGWLRRLQGYAMSAITARKEL
jgi:hypothetical protein